MSANKANIQAVIVSQPVLNPNQNLEEHAFFGSNGAPISLAPFAAATTADIITATNKTIAATEPQANTFVFIKYTAGNSVVHTIQYTGATAKTVYLGGAAPTAAKHTVAANGVVGYWFDGTYFHMLGSM